MLDSVSFSAAEKVFGVSFPDKRFVNGFYSSDITGE